MTSTTLLRGLCVAFGVATAVTTLAQCGKRVDDAGAPRHDGRVLLRGEEEPVRVARDRRVEDGDRRPRERAQLRHRERMDCGPRVLVSVVF